MSITKIHARQIFDSRGKPTVEVDLWTADGMFRAAVPSGKSTGVHEACELRDGDKTKYKGAGVTKVVANVNDIIAPALLGMDVTAQAALDAKMIELDGTPNKAKLGANGILAVSMAACRAGAAARKLPLYRHIAQLAGNPRPVLPVPSFNVINGGVHAGNALAPQEFMILPVGAASFAEAMQMGTETYHTLREIIQDKYGLEAVNVGDEGGFAPPIDSFEAALDLLTSAIAAAGYAGKIKIGIDPASSEFFRGAGCYDLQFKAAANDGSGKRTSAEMIELYASLVAKYDIIFLEDPLAEDDWEGFAAITKRLGKEYEIVGDDLLCTNPSRIERGIAESACNALLLKVNQIGTVTESIKAVQLAKGAGWGVLTSHRSGETADDFIADISVGLSTGHIKSGAPARSERVNKYNQLLRIEEVRWASPFFPDFARPDAMRLVVVLLCCAAAASAGTGGGAGRALAAAQRPTCESIPHCATCRNRRDPKTSLLELICTECAAPAWRLRRDGQRKTCDCAPGYYYVAAGAGDCLECPAGKLCRGGPANALGDCGTGLVTPGAGARSVSQCVTLPGYGRVSGRDGDGRLTVSGVLCPIGSFNKGGNRDACAQCAAGLTTEREGSTSQAACVPASSPAPIDPRGSLPKGPLVVAYYQTWSAPWASSGAAMDLAKIPSYINVVVVSFVKPDCTYTPGSLLLTGTGIDFSSSGPVVRDAIAALKAAQPNTRVMLAVGGATYTNFAGMNTGCIKALVDDFGFDGVDLDYEPTNSNCVVSSGGVSCATDAESVAVTAALRSALPAGRYLLSTASWHVGAYGVGAFANAQPRSVYTGVNLAMAASPAGQALDLINIMAYDAGNKASTGFDWSESYRAHRAVWPRQAVAIGVEIPPEAWGGNVITLPEVTTRANYARDQAGGAPYGLMLWSLHKPGCPNAQQITSAACVAFSMPGCSTPLPFTQADCGKVPPAPSPAPAPAPTPTPGPTPPGGCPNGRAEGGGACGATNGGLCCPSGQCCSQYGYCGTQAAHCGTGCQASYGACRGSSVAPSPPPASPSPSPASPVAPPPASPAPVVPGGSVADLITPAVFEEIFKHRNAPACSSNGFYTYDAFIAAANAFPGFGTASADPTVNKRELAAFLAQISHETTGGWATAPDGPYSWGLCWIQEGECAHRGRPRAHAARRSSPVSLLAPVPTLQRPSPRAGMKTPADQLAPYCAATPELPCAAGKKYFGRGPIQLSWNYNYIPAGAALGFDGLNDPDAVTRDAALAFKTAIWFWMTPRDPKPSCHAVMAGTWSPSPADVAAGRQPGFGLTTNIINGGLECGSGSVQGQEADRIGYFKRYAALLSTTTGANLDCAAQQHY
ncbi:ENO1 [Scenedesmus sp. PABB004]|nr:ENO1 [Scenedesmus sp. PABB004]